MFKNVFPQAKISSVENIVYFAMQVVVGTQDQEMFFSITDSNHMVVTYGKKILVSRYIIKEYIVHHTCTSELSPYIRSEQTIYTVAQLWCLYVIIYTGAASNGAQLLQENHSLWNAAEKMKAIVKGDSILFICSIEVF